MKSQAFIKLTPDEARALSEEISELTLTPIGERKENKTADEAIASIRQQLEALEPRRVEHTPGNWRVSPLGSVVSDSCGLVAEVIMPRRQENRMGEKLANAHLIAAAPDFLEWANGALDGICTDDGCAWSDEMVKLRAIVAKARGETK